MNLELQSKPPHKSCWLLIEYEPREEPASLVAELQEAGWLLQTRIPASFGGKEVRTYGKVGIGLFGSWTPTEQSARLLEIKTILARHGHENVLYRPLTPAQLNA